MSEFIITKSSTAAPGVSYAEAHPYDGLWLVGEVWGSDGSRHILTEAPSRIPPPVLDCKQCYFNNDDECAIGLLPVFNQPVNAARVSARNCFDFNPVTSKADLIWRPDGETHHAET